LTGAHDIAPARRGAGRWYAVAVQPHADAIAVAHLERQQFSVFAPTMSRTVRHARRFVTRRVPLFPGYLFVRLDLGRDRWRAINGTRGVRGLLTVGDRPAEVPDAAIDELLDQQEASAPLPVGTRLEIVAGPFAGLAARLQRLDGPARVTVLMQLIGTELSVSVPRAAVRRAG
jgi:transcriptional antiterminator RfaH